MSTQIPAEPTIKDRWRDAYRDGYRTIPTAADHIGCRRQSLEKAILRARNAGEDIPLPTPKVVGSEQRLTTDDRTPGPIRFTPDERHRARLKVCDLARDAADAAGLIDALGLREETA
ncbi:MAG: hypothetical protein ACRDP4_06345 [Nocardioidaceae bacterium]